MIYYFPSLVRFLARQIHKMIQTGHHLTKPLNHIRLGVLQNLAPLKHTLGLVDILAASAVEQCLEKKGGVDQLRTVPKKEYPQRNPSAFLCARLA